MLQAQLVRCFRQNVMIRLVTAKFQAILKANAIDDKMIVQMVMIAMTCHNDLKPISPQPFGKFNAKLVALLRRNFTGLKALISVVSYDTIILAVSLFRCRHTLISKLGQAIHTADKIPFFSLVGILRIRHQLFQFICVRILRLFGIFCIIDQILHRAMYCPN